MTPVRLEEIEIAGHEAALALIASSGLETADIRPADSLFLTATKDGSLAGVIGLELLGSCGLVRSMAVRADLRGQGVAQLLYDRLEAEAAARGLSQLYALTETAEAFFRKAGFSGIDRSAAPPVVAKTQQFTALCPASAAVMRLNLAERRVQS